MGGICKGVWVEFQAKVLLAFISFSVLEAPSRLALARS